LNDVGDSYIVIESEDKEITLAENNIEAARIIPEI
jgi:hypothetical protein